MASTVMRPTINMKKTRDLVTEMRDHDKAAYEKLNKDVSDLLKELMFWVPEKELQKIIESPEFLTDFIPLLHKAVTPRRLIPSHLLEYRMVKAYYMAANPAVRRLRREVREQHFRQHSEEIKRVEDARVNQNKLAGAFASIIIVGTIMQALGIKWEAAEYVAPPDEAFGQKVMRNCEGGCRAGFESTITMDIVEKPGCCLDNVCYDRDELEEYIAFSPGAAKLHSNRPINQEWLKRHCRPGHPIFNFGHSIVNFVVPSYPRVRHSGR